VRNFTFCGPPEISDITVIQFEKYLFLDKKYFFGGAYFSLGEKVLFNRQS
jgi:hypothetical protein